jgi:hypothetical protein
VTIKSPASIDLPAPYDRDPEGWAPKPPHSPRAAPGRRIAEAQAAHKTLYGRGSVRIVRETLPLDEIRHLTLLAAVASDAAELQSTHAPRYQSVLNTRAYLIAWAIWDHDREHTSSRGPIPAADPRWDDGKRGNLRDYVRQELAALLADEAAG